MWSVGDRARRRIVNGYELHKVSSTVRETADAVTHRRLEAPSDRIRTVEKPSSDGPACRRLIGSHCAGGLALRTVTSPGEPLTPSSTPVRYMIVCDIFLSQVIELRGVYGRAATVTRSHRSDTHRRKTTQW